MKLISVLRISYSSSMLLLKRDITESNGFIAYNLLLFEMKKFIRYFYAQLIKLKKGFYRCLAKSRSDIKILLSSDLVTIELFVGKLSSSRAQSR